MAVPVWAVGQVLSASDVNTWFVPLAAIKPADTGRSSNTTVTADPDLQLAVAANATYEVTAIIQYKGGTNGSSDAQFQLTVPTGTTGFVVVTGVQITSFPTTRIVVAAFGVSVNAGTSGTGNPQGLIIKATVVTAGTAGTLAVAWAQNTSSGTATTVTANSQLTARRTG